MRYIYILILCLTVNFLTGQKTSDEFNETRANQELQLAISSSDLVIEGTAIDSDYDTASDTYTATYKVSAVIKGQFSGDLITVTSTGDLLNTFLNQMYGKNMVREHSIRPSKTKIGTSGLVFLQKDHNNYRPHLTALSVVYSVVCEDPSSSCYYTEGFTSIVFMTQDSRIEGKKFSSPIELHQFLNEEYQLAVQVKDETKFQDLKKKKSY